MNLTPSAVRFDASRPCGQSHIPAGHTCHKKGSFPTRAAIAAGLGVAALGGGAYALSRSRKRPSAQGASSDPWDAPFTPRPPRPSPAPRHTGPAALPGDRTTRRLTGLTPKALLPAAPPRKSKTQRMRENTAAAARGAEQAIGRAAQAEITRAGAVANAMASAGEATGMQFKTTMRELRLRTEAARRRFEPGYRRSPSATPKAPAQLPEGGGLPVSRGRTPSKAPSTVEEWANLAPDMNALRNAMTDPRTGQPRRRQARGFGRSDNYIPFYAPVALRGIQ